MIPNTLDSDKWHQRKVYGPFSMVSVSSIQTMMLRENESVCINKAKKQKHVLSVLPFLKKGRSFCLFEFFKFQMAVRHIGKDNRLGYFSNFDFVDV